MSPHGDKFKKKSDGLVSNTGPTLLSEQRLLLITRKRVEKKEGLYSCRDSDKAVRAAPLLARQAAGHGGASLGKSWTETCLENRRRTPLDHGLLSHFGPTRFNSRNSCGLAELRPLAVIGRTTRSEARRHTSLRYNRFALSK